MKKSRYTDEQPVDASKQVIGRHMIVEPEAVEQYALRHLPTHHVRDSTTSSRIESRL